MIYTEAASTKNIFNTVSAKGIKTMEENWGGLGYVVVDKSMLLKISIMAYLNFSIAVSSIRYGNIFLQQYPHYYA